MKPHTNPDVTENCQRPQAAASATLLASPRRIQLSRKRGFKLPENTVVVSRPSTWGNPFVVGKDGTQKQVVLQFTAAIYGTTGYADQARRELRGKNLACWCPIDAEWCHADVLLKLANEKADQCGGQ